MSWLKNALDDNAIQSLLSSDFYIGTTLFDMSYAPTRVPIDDEQKQIGSLVIRHRHETGVIFRYKMFIKRAGGDFVQWGAEGDECHPYWDVVSKAFGPDVCQVEQQPAPPFGIFGLTHAALVQSEWVEDDTLTVKVQVEVMEDSSVVTEAPTSDVVVPLPTITTNLLSMLEDARNTDTTFIVEERRISAHSQILSARSEVFDRELNGSMQESISKVVEIKDVEFATFNVFLRFLYTDDLNQVASMIKSQIEMEKPQAAAGSSGDATQAGKSRTTILQNILAASHKYQVQRLQLWCEQELCKHICKDEVCTILCQAHLYDAKQLEKVCLGFIKNHMEPVMSTRTFGSLSSEWPEVMLKINIFLAGLSEIKASEVITAHEESRKKRGAQQSVEELATGNTKCARCE